MHVSGPSHGVTRSRPAVTVRGGFAPTSAERRIKPSPRSCRGRRRPRARLDREGGGGSGRARAPPSHRGARGVVPRRRRRRRRRPGSRRLAALQQVGRARTMTGGEPGRGRERDGATDPAPHILHRWTSGGSADCWRAGVRMGAGLGLDSERGSRRGGRAERQSSRQAIHLHSSRRRAIAQANAAQRARRRDAEGRDPPRRLRLCRRPAAAKCKR